MMVVIEGLVKMTEAPWIKMKADNKARN